MAENPPLSSTEDGLKVPEPLWEQDTQGQGADAVTKQGLVPEVLGPRDPLRIRLKFLAFHP